MNEAVPIPTTLPELAAFYPRADWVWLGSHLFALTIPLVFLFSGASPRLRTACARIARGNRYGTIVLMAVGYLTLAAILFLPVGFLTDLVFIRAWNGPTPSTPQWIAGQAAGLLRSFVLAAALAWIPYALMARVARLWWLLSAAAIVPVIAVVMAGYQLLLIPLWTHFHSIGDPSLAAQFQALAERCGVMRLPVYVGGNDSTVVGVGPFLRLVLEEDPDLTRSERVVAFAHELKHYVLDGWKPIGLIAALLALGFWLVHILGRRALRVWHHSLGFSELADPASLPLAVFILSASWLLLGLPVWNAVQRHVELEADRFALELTRDNHSAALLQVHRSKYSLNEFYPFYRIWRADHPSQADRVRLANTYHPWTSASRPVYGNVCQMN
jgi:STE24 endopeptidase